MDEINKNPGYDIDELESIGRSYLFFTVFREVSREKEKFPELFDNMGLNKQRLRDVSPDY